MSRLFTLVLTTAIVSSCIVFPASSHAFKGDFPVTNVAFKQQNWTPSKTSKNSLSFVVTNATATKARTSYLVTFTSNDTSDKIVYKKKGTTKKLAPNATQTITIPLSSKSVSRKFTEGYYRAEIFVEGAFEGGDSFSVVTASSKTAGITVSTPFDNYTYGLGKGMDLPVHVDVIGELPEGGYVDLVVIYKDQSWWSPASPTFTLPKNFTGRYTYTIPYSQILSGKSYPVFKANEYQYVAGRLYSGKEDSNGPRIAEDQTDTWIYVY